MSIAIVSRAGLFIVDFTITWTVLVRRSKCVISNYFQNSTITE